MKIFVLNFEKYFSSPYQESKITGQKFELTVTSLLTLSLTSDTRLPEEM